jgi:hypothetical protein
MQFSNDDVSGGTSMRDWRGTSVGEVAARVSHNRHWANCRTRAKSNSLARLLLVVLSAMTPPMRDRSVKSHRNRGGERDQIEKPDIRGAGCAKQTVEAVAARAMHAPMAT